ncbi:MAG TPA: D-alanyl-D-alanine carboxypeptidase/D-alanyl-D-alanine-endopeptidase [Candidatus Sulfopaludibacter sp.]|jgi:D-alanyl-D-alanine carboxypeptidase/D-alanyl-D-alanine-endopeptidase (penicillin-binding protein 4)|nr:D-alanyl-D-alanine carboxypeptidase/D-alanyl-D-alanine-endopeptidase [Candidatus Sulfopaludibacter sp.]
MTKRAYLLLLLLLAGLNQAVAASLADRIEALIAASPSASGAFWGIQAVDLSGGATLFELNANHFFIPASNTKLFTTAMALSRLGPEFTFQTRVLATVPIDANGTIAGDLRLLGGGDPNLSARPIPYQKGAITGNPLIAIEDLADQIAAKGVKRVDGNILGDDSWYVWEPYAPGWALDDPLYDYGAPVSALTLSDNTLTLNVLPGKHEGDLAALALKPALEYYRIDNRIRTVAAGGERRIHYDRPPGTLDLELWGTIPLRDRGEDLLLGIEDPAQFAAMALRQALEDRGIAVQGKALALHVSPNQLPSLVQAAEPEAPAGIELARRVSAPLLEDLRITDKVSQNLHAEMALRAVARARRNLGSREAGLAELKDFLIEAGVAADQYGINDGSGLSRQNLVTPATVVKLLRFMYQSPARENWISLLPVGGQDGTLEKRFSDPAMAGRVHAKTGSVAHVSALSGYFRRAGGEWVAFSILVNNFNGPTAEIRNVMDRICATIMEE